MSSYGRPAPLPSGRRVPLQRAFSCAESNFGLVRRVSIVMSCSREGYGSSQDGWVIVG